MIYYAIFYKVSRIKIGQATCPTSRLQGLGGMLGETPYVIALTKGFYKEEWLAFQHLQSWHIGGEWFENCLECKTAIYKYVADIDDPVMCDWVNDQLDRVKTYALRGTSSQSYKRKPYVELSQGGKRQREGYRNSALKRGDPDPGLD